MSEKKSALNWLRDTYNYNYSPQLTGLARAVQAYADYCQQFDHDIAREALNDLLRELSELTGLERSVGYVAQLQRLKKMLKEVRVQ